MNLLRNLVRSILVLIGLAAIFLMLSRVVSSTQDAAQFSRDSEASSKILNYHVAEYPFGKRTFEVKPGVQYFWDMQIRRTPGMPCYVDTSWRWVLHIGSGRSVMWNTSDGEFFVGDKSETLSQAFTVPEKLLPGKYTLTRLAKYKCGNAEGFARTVRSIEVEVKDNADKN